MNVIGHDDVGVEKVVGSVMIDGFEEKRGVALDLEEAATVMSGCSDEIRAGSGVWLGIAMLRL
jgi:hypothetical protein